MSTQINILSANPYTITGGLFAQTGNSNIITNTTYSDIFILNKTY
jgi:hypothetical protein